MLNIPFILLAAGSLSTLIAGAPIPSSPLSAARHEEAVPAFTPSLSLNKRTTVYNVLGGAGKLAQGWPSLDAWWPSFDEMFEANRDTMANSCTQWNVPNNSDDEIDNISAAIKEVSETSGVDARYILAIVIQESNGCVRAPTTNYGVTNPGLMQSHNGLGSCNNGEVLSPCPYAQIKQMITDGTVGTSDGDGLVGCLKAAGGTSDVSSYYRAARIYNSGSIDSSGNLGLGIATHCYSSDVANRLTGWATGPSSCVPDTIGTLNAAVTTNFRFAGSSTSDDSSESDETTVESSSTTTTTTTTTQAPAPTTSASTTTTAAPAPTPEPEADTVTSTTTTTTTMTYTLVHVVPTSTTTPSSAPTAPPATSAPAASSTAAPIYPYADSACKEYYTVVEDDYCLKVESAIGVSLAELRELNSGLKEDCTNLWLGYQYCIKA